MLIKIINADDMGISPGVNRAIAVGFDQGILNSTSLMMNVAYTSQAVKLLRARPGLAVGIHLNLTNQRNQKPLANVKEIPLLVDKKGCLKHGFLGLLFLSMVRPKAFIQQAEKEMRAQIDRAFFLNLRPVHLDSHRHVHMIPGLFRLTQRLAQEYGIARVRIVNESFWKTLSKTHQWRCLIDGGFIKWMILKGFSIFNRVSSDTYFYSILHTTRLFGSAVRDVKVPLQYKRVEIGLHPSDTNMDACAFEAAFFDYLLDRPDRQKEWETVLDKNFPKRISY